MIDKNVYGILRFELASFWDKKSRLFWERLEASFLNKKFNVNDCIEFSGFFEKRTERIMKNDLIFCSEMALAQFSGIYFSIRIHG